MKASVERKTHNIDATDQVLGRLATRVATLLMGKHKAIYQPNADLGDIVHIANAARIRVTGRKADQKVYKHYSGYQGGLKETPFARLQAKNPEEIIRKAVTNMLPHNRLRAGQLKRLKITA